MHAALATLETIFCVTDGTFRWIGLHDRNPIHASGAVVSISKRVAEWLYRENFAEVRKVRRSIVAPNAKRPRLNNPIVQI
jgi:hypothetical protein